MSAIATTSASKALGPYFHGRIANKMLYTAGQIGLDAAANVMAEAQIRQVLAKFRAIVEAGGLVADEIGERLATVNPAPFDPGRFRRRGLSYA